ncbi:MAG: ABC transporter ATP-binding protein [Gammaproteobacteria bacterium]|nr:ABC transporter ATP-binding protein [Gammaproteobacteria bacterium]
MSSAIVRCRALSRIYNPDALPVVALDQVDFAMDAGEFVSLAGPSGSGKSTLLNLIGGLDRPTSGEIVVDGQDLGALSERELADLRLHRLGFVFQAYNLVPVLSARENVEFILQLQGVDARTRKATAMELLERVGLADLAERRPGELSGGQQQRVAVARAISTSPALLLADEPSANLDSAATESLLKLFAQLNEEREVTILTATHDPVVQSYARRRLQLRDGRIVSDERA